MRAVIKTIFEERGSPWHDFLKKAISHLEIVEDALLNKNIPLLKWKEVLSREAKIKSLNRDN